MKTQPSPYKRQSLVPSNLSDFDPLAHIINGTPDVWHSPDVSKADRDPFASNVASRELGAVTLALLPSPVVENLLPAPASSSEAYSDPFTELRAGIESGKYGADFNAQDKAMLLETLSKMQPATPQQPELETVDSTPVSAFQHVNRQGN